MSTQQSITALQANALQAICPSTAVSMALPSLPKEAEIRLDSADVSAFFPSKLGEILQLPDADIRFFGTLHVECRESGGIRVVYFLVPYLLRSTLPPELTNLRLWRTDDDRIRGTAKHYYEMTEKYPELKDTEPLVALGLRCNWFQEEQSPLKFMELQRYADHARFRGRGLASSILMSVCEHLKSKGTEYLYLNFPAERWPKSSPIIPNQFASADLIKKIDGCFSPDSGYAGFKEDLSPSGFIVITDPAQHSLECQKAETKKKI